MHVTSLCVCVLCDTGLDFYSPQKQRHGGISSENPLVNGNLYTPEHRLPSDAYVTSQEHNGNQAEDLRGSHQTSVVENLRPLYGISELDIASSPADESNGPQVVKSLLRAMLAKPRPGDVSALIEMTTRSEFDSGSEDTGEPQGPVVDPKDEDSQPANDTIARDDATAMESETDTKQNWMSSSSVTTSPEKASRCPYCLKMFRYRSSYRRHVKIHEGVFSHECTICMRKFTRKEHFVRHKCDRRPNKPYNVTHEAFRRMSTSQKAAMRHVLKSAAVAGVAVRPMGPAAASQELDGPLELTCQSVGKPVDMPKLLFTGGSVSSLLPTSLDCITSSACSPIVTSTPAQSSDITSSSLRGMDIAVPSHNESRRKSSTPRKVVSATNGTMESDSCRGNLPASRISILGSLPVSVMD